MAAVLLRRSFATASVAAVATSVLLFGAPLLGTAHAAAPAKQSESPAAGSTVKATRPHITVTFDRDLDSTSTISLTVAQDSTPVNCPKLIAQKSIGCTPSVDLEDKVQYSVEVHAVDKATKDASDPSPSAFTVDIPSITTSTPTDGGLASRNTDSSAPITVTYDEGIYNPATVAHLYELNADGTKHNEISGTLSYSGGNSTPGTMQPDRTVTFKTDVPLGLGGYLFSIHVDSATPDSTGLSKGTDNKDSYSNDEIHFTVPSPPVAPTITDSPPYINRANADKVPFAGTAKAGETVTVTISNGSGTSASDFVVVEECGGNPCPWSLLFNTTASTNDPSGGTHGGNLPDGNYNWTANAHNPNGDAATNPVAIVKDTTGPAAPSSVTDSINGDTLTVTLKDTANDTAGYDVTVTDSAATPNIVTKTGIPAGADTDHTGTGTVDVSSLVDGPLTVKGMAVDAPYGNEGNPTTGQTVQKETVLLAPDYSKSFYTVDGAAKPFNGTQKTVIRSPTSLTLTFNEPINTGPVNKYESTDPTHTQPCPPAGATCTQSTLYPAPSLKVIDTSHNQQIAGTVSVTDDKTGLKFTPKSTPLADDDYAIVNVFATADTCEDQTPANASTYSCERYDSTQPQAGQPGEPVATFSVDTTPPSAPTVTVSPSPVINASAASSVHIFGTAEKNATIKLTIKSSGGGSTLLAHGGQPIPVDNNGNWTTNEDLTSLPDGTLTIKAFAIDPAGNKSSATKASPSPKLKAHGTTLTSHVSDGVITNGDVVTVRGRLFDTSSRDPISGAKVVVRPRLPSGKFMTAHSALTDADGKWHVQFVPHHNVVFYASYAGSTSASAPHDADKNTNASVDVRVALVFTAPKDGAKVGSPVTLKGRVKPNKGGEFVYFYKHTKHGNVLLGRDKLNSKSRWAFKVTLARGTTEIFAKMGKTHGNLGNRSKVLELRH